MQDYLERGPGFIFLYHPALGPLWDVISQKVCGCSMRAQPNFWLPCCAVAWWCQDSPLLSSHTLCCWVGAGPGRGDSAAL